MEPFYFLNIYKPKGITSFDVIYKLRKILKIKKIGHSGTLDPMAEGVMQIAVGGTSRLLEYLDSDKEYIAEVKFGYFSTTLDAEGEITKTIAPKFSESELKTVIDAFKGKIIQTPPKYSAIKVNGKKLCDIARKNPDAKIEIPKREIEIYGIELLDFNNYIATIKVKCSKGTYIRTLAEDIAKKLSTDAYLTKLTRTSAGNFKIEDSIKIEDINPDKDCIPPVQALNLKQYNLDEKEFNLVKNGVQIQSKKIINNGIVMLVYMNKLVSIGEISDNKIKVKKFFNII